jgi:hypothetical protein
MSTKKESGAGDSLLPAQSREQAVYCPNDLKAFKDSGEIHAFFHHLSLQKEFSA